MFLQVVSQSEHHLPIPGEKFGFATLRDSQAAGDLQALQARGRRVGRVDIEDLRKVR